MKTIDIFRESFLLALQALWSSKIRSFLTILGIIIGVMTVIAMMSILEGFDQFLNNELKAFETDTFMVSKFPAFGVSGSEWQKYRNRKNLTTKDAFYVKNRGETVKFVGPMQWTSGKKAKYRNTESNPNVSVYGAMPEFLRVGAYEIDEGRFLSDFDVLQSRRVCVIGHNLRKFLFPSVNPIGKKIRISGEHFTVIGTLKEKTEMFHDETAYDTVIPITMFGRLYGKERDTYISVQTAAASMIQQTVEEVIALLRIIRKVKPGRENDFEITTKEIIMERVGSIMTIVAGASLGICSIALLVGGIGIMNIMLVTVTERTMEIGVRKALGATRRVILSQFVIEAVTIASVGGVLGVAAGIGIGKIASMLTGLPSAISLWSVFLGIGFSAIVGIFFGIFPAMKAARLEPIAALRYE